MAPPLWFDEREEEEEEEPVLLHAGPAGMVVVGGGTSPSPAHEAAMNQGEGMVERLGGVVVREGVGVGGMGLEGEGVTVVEEQGGMKGGGGVMEEAGEEGGS